MRLGSAAFPDSTGADSSDCLSNPSVKVALHLELIYCSSWTASTTTLRFEGTVMPLTVLLPVTGMLYP